jgi:hypothetical protein
MVVLPLRQRGKVAGEAGRMGVVNSVRSDAVAALVR